jgi:transcriptional regulator with XRE-family HTH domain
MKFNEKYNIDPEFEDLFNFKNEEEQLDHDAKMIMFRFFNELEKLEIDTPIRNKDIAEIFGSSKSYVTQLMRGDKLINLLKIAKLQKSYDITFEIKAKHNSENYRAVVEHNYPLAEKKTLNNDLSGFWVYHNSNKTYENFGGIDYDPSKNKTLKVA